MARNQKLIHYHSSGETNQLVVSNLSYGEIAVRHNENKPELYIRVNESALATFIDSAAIEGKLSAITSSVDSKISSIETSIGTLSSATENFITSAMTNFATSANVDTAIEGIVDAIETLSADTLAEIGKVDSALTIHKNTYDSKMSSIDSQIAGLGAASASLSSELSELATEVDANYSAITDATTGLIALASGETLKQASAITVDAKDALTAITEQIKNDYATNAALGTVSENLQGQITSLATEVDANYSAITDATTGLIALASADAYSKAVTSAISHTNDKFTSEVDPLKSTIETLTGSAEGSISSMISAGIATITSGAPKAFDTLKEIADWIADGSGTTAAEIVTDIESLKSAETAITTSLSAVSGTLLSHQSEYAQKMQSIDSQIAGLGAASASLSSELSELATEVDANYSAITDATTGLIALASGETLSQASAITFNVNETLTAITEDLGSRITDLENLSGTTNSALQTVSGTASGISGVTITPLKEGTNAKLTIDFTNMVIDCGEF